MVNKNKQPPSGNGICKLSLEWVDEDTGTIITSFEETRTLQHLFKKEHLPVAEHRIFELLESTLAPFRVELVSYVNKLIADNYKEEPVKEPLEPIPIGKKDELDDL